jgi:hypothetical protein
LARSNSTGLQAYGACPPLHTYALAAWSHATQPSAGSDPKAANGGLRGAQTAREATARSVGICIEKTPSASGFLMLCKSAAPARPPRDAPPAGRQWRPSGSGPAGGARSGGAERALQGQDASGVPAAATAVRLEPRGATVFASQIEHKYHYFYILAPAAALRTLAPRPPAGGALRGSDLQAAIGGPLGGARSGSGG